MKNTYDLNHVPEKPVPVCDAKTFKFCLCLIFVTLVWSGCITAMYFACNSVIIGQQHDDYVMSESTRQEWFIKSKEICGDERFLKYDNCSNSNFIPYIPSVYDRRQDLENTKVIEACNEACYRVARPSMFVRGPYGSHICGIVFLAIFCVIFMIASCGSFSGVLQG